MRSRKLGVDSGEGGLVRLCALDVFRDSFPTISIDHRVAMHPNKHIAAALDYAKSHGWDVKKSKGKSHAWGVLLCPGNGRGACRISVASTPRQPETHAKRLTSKVDKCRCGRD